MRKSVNIFGIIGLETLAQWLIPEIQAVENDPSADTLVVNITNTPGGDIHEGFAIRDALELFKRSGKKVITRGTGFVGSVSTVIFMAGDERELTESTTFYIHNPLVTNASGGADDLRKIANYIDDQEAQARKIYEAGSNLDGDQVDFLMQHEVYLTAEEALALGFATSVLHLTEVLLTAKSNIMSKFLDDFKKLVPNFGGGNNPKLLALNLSDGRVANVVTDQANPVPGAGITVDGKPLDDGEYKTQSGYMLKVKAGKIEEVQKQEVTNEMILQAIVAMNARVEDLEERSSAVEMASLALARGQVSGSFTPPASGIQSGKDNEEGKPPREAPKMEYQTVQGTMSAIQKRVAENKRK